VFLDVWVRISNGSSIMGDDVGDLVLSHGLALDSAELESSLLGVDFVSLISALGIVENSELFSCFLDGDYIHNSKWESGVSSDFLVLNDFNSFLTRKSIVQSVSKKHVEGYAFSSFVGSG